MSYSRALLLFVSLSLGWSSLAEAAVIRGPATAVDGDTLAMTGARVRLFGIDAPEKSQTCARAGETWACGQEATAVLARLIDGKEVSCQQISIDRYGRMVAKCTVGNRDLGEMMVRAGLAIALPQFSDAYTAPEAGAKAMKAGIWSSEFQTPADYRAAHPREFAPPKPRAPVAAERPARSQVYYRNCREAWVAGAAPIYRGQPGYRPEMDGDNDGIACEPYRGRRR
jgi:endonuclease YncB( thermonuclease family)